MAKVLDLFCGGGGAGVGYSRAGYSVTGVDIKLQSKYPFDFILGDALKVALEIGREYDLIHASPVCKGYTRLRALHPDKEYPDQIAEMRNVLDEIGKPYVIENVPGAPLKNYVMLCGSMFGLRVYRHRLFECNPQILFSPMVCNHWAIASGNRAMRKNKRLTPNLNDFDIITVAGHDFILEDARIAMGIDWMGQKEISQAVPPVYTEWIGLQILKLLA